MSQDKTEKMEHFISLLDDYIDGILSAGQTSEIEKALQEDSFLNEVLKQHVQARANMRSAGEAELRNKFANSFPPIPEQPKPKSNLLKYIIGLVLVLALAAIVYMFFKGENDAEKQRPFTASVEEGSDRMLLASVEDPSYDLLRSDRDTMIAESWQRAVQSFISKEYKATLETLSSLQQDSSFLNNHIGKYSLMKGVSNLKLEKYNEADQALTRITSENPYYDQAEWYLALTYFYAQDKVEAKSQLEKIANNESHYKREKAQLYLNQLQNQ